MSTIDVGETAGLPIGHARPLQRTERGLAGVGAGRRSTRVLEALVAFVLLLLALPLIAVLMLLVLLVDGRPALYRGERMGLGKRGFRMYKIRTLRREASQRTAGRLLEASDHLEIPLGRLLRDSRLDELPQLWSVVRGDMSFVGPRPERLEVYHRLCKSIPGYARRFEVRPGLLGPSQVFTPHGTGKRLRSWLDNAWNRRSHTPSSVLGLTTLTGIAVLAKAGQRLTEMVVRDSLRCRILGGFPQRRRCRRVRIPRGSAILVCEDGQRFEVLDIDDHAVAVRSRGGRRAVSGGQACLCIEIRHGVHGRRFREARCEVEVVARRETTRGQVLVLGYRSCTPQSHYLVHQYFLKSSLVSPRGSAPRRARVPAGSTPEWLPAWVGTGR